MTLPQRLLTVVLSLLATSTSGCLMGVVTSHNLWTSRAEEKLPLDAATLTAMEVATQDGSVVFEACPDDSADAYVLASKRGGGWSPASAKAAQEAIEVYVKGDQDGQQQVGWRWKTLKRPGWSAEVSFEIHAPAGISLEARAHNGSISVSGLRGDARLKSENGGIHVDAGGGTLSAEAHNGGINATYAGEELALVSYNGRVQADVSACSSLKGRVVTYNGGVRLTVGPQTSVRLTCGAYNGRITCDAPVTVGELSRATLTGTLGGGDGQLVLRSYNGSVRIQKASG